VRLAEGETRELSGNSSKAESAALELQMQKDA
jgi:hypothetical protein